jgi:hypothetical protein
MILAADEGEALAKLQDQQSQMLDQATLEIALQHFRTKREEVKCIGILENLLGELRLFSRKGAREVGQCAALTSEQIAVDLMSENVPAPAVLDRLPGVPGPFLGRPDSVEKAHVMAPRQ